MVYRGDYEVGLVQKARNIPEILSEVHVQLSRMVAAAEIAREVRKLQRGQVVHKRSSIRSFKSASHGAREISIYTLVIVIFDKLHIRPWRISSSLRALG